MIENLLKLVLENAKSEIIDNPEIPNEHNDVAVSTVAHSIADTLQKTIAGGGLKQVLSLMGGKTQISTSPIANQMINSLVEKFSAKFGISPAIAKVVADGIVPKVLNSFVKKTNDQNDSDFDLNGVLSVLSGGKTQGLNLGSLLERVKVSPTTLEKDNDDSKEDDDFNHATQVAMNGAKEARLDFGGVDFSNILGSVAKGAIGSFMK